MLIAVGYVKTAAERSTGAEQAGALGYLDAFAPAVAYKGQNSGMRRQAVIPVTMLSGSPIRVKSVNL